MAIPLPHLLLASVVLLVMLTGVEEAEASEAKAVGSKTLIIDDNDQQPKVCKFSGLSL
ncbi:hypothetical protein [Motiliproteus coralliicola]|uniref:hypothetical protein n=1 Tax=Motiliproteus coralliicola TaxID=2283196 RepID=UPI001403340C|nr:hypothetical protein [Motiliproteus coralliicola]